MRLPWILVVSSFGFLAPRRTKAFFSAVPLHGVATLPSRTGEFYMTDNDETAALRPRTSFGAEAVPEAQRPVNEFLDVTEQPMFGWAKTGTKGLLTRLVILYSVVFGVICWPISSATFTQEGYLLQKLTASNVGAVALVFVVLLRLYAGWGYIGTRLQSAVIEYEETGWYDGDWERKTQSELSRDKMLYNSQVKPVVLRVKTFTAGAAGLLLASIVTFNVSMDSKPMFNQYDPALLERLSYDETLAERAAKNTAGKPAYCDSRYYRAVANGGQGC